MSSGRVPEHYRRGYGHLFRYHQDELHSALCDVAIALDCPFSRMIGGSMTDRQFLEGLGGQIARVAVVAAALIALGLALAGLAATAMLVRWLLGL